MKHSYMVDNEVHRCDGMWVTSFRSLQQSTCTKFIALVLQVPQKISFFYYYINLYRQHYLLNLSNIRIDFFITGIPWQFFDH